LNRLGLILICTIFFLGQAYAGDPLRAIFLSPGSKDGAFFGPLISLMEEAALDLDIELEIVEANRDHLEMTQKGNEILDRKELPDYLLLANEHGTAVHLIERANLLGVKVFLLNEGLNKKRYVELGGPRQKLKNWLGELIPNDRQSGYLLAKNLIEQALDNDLSDVNGALHLVGLNGTHKTNSAAQRLLGLQDALTEFPNVKLHQVVYAYWKEEKAYKATQGLLKRYPQTNVIWSASDLMAQGAMRAVIEARQKPGADILLGGVDWADLAFDHVREGSISATVGGHFFDGAWAMVMLYDYHNGYDFITRSKSNFSIVTKDNIHLFDHYLKTSHDRAQIDFKAFSKTHKNPFNTHRIFFGKTNRNAIELQF